MFLIIISFSLSVTFPKMQAVLSFSLPCQWYTPIPLLQHFICLHDYLGIFDIASQSDLESLYFKSFISSLICVCTLEEVGVEFNDSFSRYPNLWSNLILHVSQFAFPLFFRPRQPLQHSSSILASWQVAEQEMKLRPKGPVLQNRRSPVLETNRRINNPVVDIVTWRTRNNTTQATGEHVNLYSSE